MFIRLDALQPDPRFIEHGKHLDNVPNRKYNRSGQVTLVIKIMITVQVHNLCEELLQYLKFDLV